MRIATIAYIVNAILLLLHEIDSAYWKEWEIFGLPGGISGFLLLHAPLLAVLFAGTIELEKSSTAGTVIGVIAGVCGLLPFVIHHIVFRRINRFDTVASTTIIYLTIASGIVTIISSLF
jgi:hypothetical protein